MFVCKFCQKTFSNVTKLVSHLTHPKSPCKTSIKEYYDRFFRLPDEGVCIYCGRETAFGSLVKGYPFSVCKYCKNKKPETIEKQKRGRKKLYEQRRKQNGYYNYPEVCLLCKERGIEKRFQKRSGLARHVNNYHHMKPKDYYDKYLKIPGEGICPITKKKTNFINLERGYFKYYGKGTCSADSDVHKKKVKTLQHNYNVSCSSLANPEQRINTFKATFEERRKLKQARLSLINCLRKQTIDITNKLQCQICGLVFSTFLLLTNHIRKHKISSQEYYDKFWKEKEEGLCPISNLPTNFISINFGYYKYHRSAVTFSPEMLSGHKEHYKKYVQEKIKETEYNFNVKFLDIESIQNIDDLTKVKCLLCGFVYKTRYTLLANGYGRCSACSTQFSKGYSKNEEEIYNYVKSILPDNTKIIRNCRGVINNTETQRNLELDIYIPSLSYAIEYNGLYWHSECVQDNKFTHLNKTNLCQKKGIALIQIFEDEWIYKQELVKHMIAHKLNRSHKSVIYARKCFVEEIPSKVKSDFLQKNHIQGNDAASVSLGLFNKRTNELLAVMTFSHGNISRGGKPSEKTVWELSRFATNINYRVVGAAGKILAYFKKHYTWSKIYTYADLRYSKGELYYNLGFRKVNQSLPNYWYVQGTKRIHRFALRKRPDEPKEMPEWLLRYNEGFVRIWDCGNLKFEVLNI